MSEVICRKCRRTFEPSPAFDFYPDGEDPEIGLCEHCLMDAVFNKEPVSLPTPEFATAVCKRGQGHDCCVFLVYTTGEFRCARGSGLNNTIVEKAKNNQMKARCVNCSGGIHEPKWELKNPPFDYDNVED